MLKLNMWSNHIFVSQFLSLNLNLEEKKISLSHASARSLWISTQDQLGTVILKLIFFLQKKSACESERSLDRNQLFNPFLDLLLLFFSFFSFLDYAATMEWKPAHKGHPTALGCGRERMPKREGHLDIQGRREGERKRARGAPKVVWGY